MIDWPVFVVVSTAVVSMTMVMASVVHLRTTRHPTMVLNNGIRHRGAEHARSAVRHPDAWPADWTHAAPPREFTIAEAHSAMQEHRTCGVDDCAYKAAAFTTLVEKGRVKPDSSRCT